MTACACSEIRSSEDKKPDPECDSVSGPEIPFMNLKILGLLLALVTGVLPLTAQTTYRSFPSDCVGYFSGFAIDASGRLYGFGDVFGMWRSDDAGLVPTSELNNHVTSGGRAVTSVGQIRFRKLSATESAATLVTVFEHVAVTDSTSSPAGRLARVKISSP